MNLIEISPLQLVLCLIFVIIAGISILELLSPSNPDNDKNTKKALDRDEFEAPEYFWFDSNAEKLLAERELAGFRLVQGVYQPIQPNARGHLWSQSLELFLGVENAIAFD